MRRSGYHANAADQTSWIYAYPTGDAYQKVSLNGLEHLLLGHISYNALSVHRGQGMAYCSRLSQFTGPVDSASLQGCKGSDLHWQHAIKVGLHSTVTLRVSN